MHMKQHRIECGRIVSIILLLIGMAAQLHSQCTAVIGSNIDPVAGCEVLTVQFYDNSSGVVTRSWDFGDGSAVSNAQNPTHSFQAGEGDTTYTVILTIVCSGGSTLTAEKTVAVYAKPQIDFNKNKSSVCAITDSVCLTNLTIDRPGNSYLWNFGDGTISTEYEPCKVYSTPGSYSLELTVTNEHGCMNSLNKEDYFEVIPVPNTAFTVRDLNGCIPFTEFFINNTDTAGNS
ncbi:MAG: PKD domain-containing protein, partial [Bacteroidales bacterium]|nr:PKD domain-containing protein [Bacteroidales bacterium]